MAEVALEVKNLRTYFRQDDGRIIKAVDGVSFYVKKGETLCLVGESGSGKSITALSIMGLLPKPKGRIESGEILYYGRNLVGLQEEQFCQLRGNGLSMIFQEPLTALNPVLTIGDQVAEVLITHGKIGKKDALKKAKEMLNMVGIPHVDQVIQNYPHQISGGMRQRVMIAMALISKPDVLIADEPTTALDVTIQAQVLDLIKKMKKELNTTVILITHDMGVVADMADYIAVMYAGQIVEMADADTLFESPQHPYTKALMRSIPFIDRECKWLYSIRGSVPEAIDNIKGCRFAPRCDSFCRESCACDEEVPLVECSTGHWVRCLQKSERSVFESERIVATS